MSAMSELFAHQRQTEALAQVMGRLGWDQETMMPPGAAEQRGEEVGALESVLHARRSDPWVGEMLALAEPGTEADAAQLRLIERAHRRATKVPADLAAELARVTSVAQGVWARARAADDFAAFLPTLSHVVRLKRVEAEALAGGSDLYDALVDDFEPGMTAAELGALFGRMRPRLVDLRARILAGGAPPPALAGRFPKDIQLALSAEIARAFGYDFEHGRIDLAVHPFSSGSGADVRITTRVDEMEPLGCFYSTIHEVGHAAYEQNVSRDYALTPLGQGVSMGVHESQSRIYENQLGRSAAFTGWLYGRMRDMFGDIGVDGPEAFHATVNRVTSGYIRTEADEVHYNLHVMLRFDLERALISGDLAVGDLEAAWNDRFRADFGVSVDQPRHGVLQDVHWSVGLFGYFPTYSLGNVYAGVLHEALRADLPDLDASLAKGDPSPATAWLRERLQRHGGLRPPRDTIEHAAGRKVSEAPLLDYLDAKFGAIYGV
ncbi:carboxypeptidase M32 [Roseibacterium sp. SDUM158017]|uniref:carboxypeptidase M32 n=1 Tax=Roseicyclus salinarum TaxID=3036773 RepID=UPI00241589F4|nr:carboxypeptidase M32 [Roseibacterium sp. SDUM158017]MDG4648356.1 carboxypeptidase M32 [Roseibacterium sp. SDUM158017]